VRQAALPVALMAVPVLIALAQLEGRCGRRPLRVGEAALITVRVRPGQRLDAAAPLGLDPGVALALETAALRLPATGEGGWRGGGPGPGLHAVTVRVGEQAALKQVAVGQQLRRVSPVRTGAGWWALLRHPGEPPLDAGGGILEVAVDYPRRWLGPGGWWTSWGLTAGFALLSIGVGWLCKGWWKVEM
jgi:hypothetical protein